MKNQRSLWIWLAVFATLLFLELPGTHLFDPDETRYAEIPREMIATQDWLTPRLNGADYFEKPPLLYWLNASCMKVFGENPFAARLPTRLSTLAVVALLHLPKTWIHPDFEARVMAG
jgi:4-amino-4-deoxy-L-arabinose transferase-like glycosyltransferase